ncbi:MAG: hypothetical protein PHD43_00560 [Methylococcales bacterium]|nr:hypothetical protein [Methylococcales bacterium]
MKKKVILQIVIPLFVSTLLIACDEVRSLTEQNVVLASGVNFNNDKYVVIAAESGKRVKSCGKTIIIEKDNPTVQGSDQSNPSSTGAQTNQPCNNQIFEPSQELLNALRITSPIKGFIIKDNGEKTEARFFVAVKALYPSSHCNSDFLNGDAWTNCVTQDAIDSAFP